MCLKELPYDGGGGLSVNGGGPGVGSADDAVMGNSSGIQAAVPLLANDFWSGEEYGGFTGAVIAGGPVLEPLLDGGIGPGRVLADGYAVVGN